MANSIPYASSTASALLDLMDIAGGDLSQAFLPANLNLVTTFSSPLISSGGVQGLLATGTMPGVTGQVAVLVVAAAWPQFNSFYQLSYLTATVDAPPYLQSPGGHADNLSL